MFRLKQGFLILSLIIISAGTAVSQNKSFSRLDKFPFQDPSLPLEERVSDIVSRMTLDEKVKQMLYNAPAISRLGVPEYNWCNEALHGVARAGRATVFPQSIGLAAT